MGDMHSFKIAPEKTDKQASKQVCSEGTYRKMSRKHFFHTDTYTISGECPESSSKCYSDKNNHSIHALIFNYTEDNQDEIKCCYYSRVIEICEQEIDKKCVILIG